MPSAAGRRDDLECAPRCSAHNQRNLLFIFVFQKRLRAFLEHFFTRGVVKINGICGDTPSVIAYGDATFPKGTAFGMAIQFPTKAQSFRAFLLPLGGAGERSEPEGLWMEKRKKR